MPLDRRITQPRVDLPVPPVLRLRSSPTGVVEACSGCFKVVIPGGGEVFAALCVHDINGLSNFGHRSLLKHSCKNCL